MASETRKFPLATPRRWKNKQSGKEHKVLPWFQPIDDASRFDFKGMMKEIAPEVFTNDILANCECYSGLVMQLGWMIENENRIWIGVMQMDMTETFEDVGAWKTNGTP